MNVRASPGSVELSRQFRRPTILDGLILTGALAAGLAVARTSTLAGEGGRWQSFFCLTWIVAATLALPTILGMQFLRGRRRLGFGEAVWLLPATLYLLVKCADAWISAVWISAKLPDWATVALLCALLCIHGVCALAALVYLAVAFESRPVWTEWLGALACVTTLAAVVLLIHFGVEDAYFSWGHHAR